MGEDELSEIVGICKRPVSVFLMKIMNAEKMRGWHADLVIDSCTLGPGSRDDSDLYY